MRVAWVWGCATALLVATGSLGGQQGSSTDAPAGARLLLSAKGVGVQIYGCKEDEGKPPVWVLTAPEAKLLEERNGSEIGLHTAGPMWRYKDGSMVTGEVIAKSAAPDAGSIPWLLLRARSRAGDGLMAQVAFIRRFSTKGGAAPVEGCDAAHVGAVSRVPYSAAYGFYAER